MKVGDPKIWLRRIMSPVTCTQEGRYDLCDQDLPSYEWIVAPHNLTQQLKHIGAATFVLHSLYLPSSSVADVNSEYVNC